MTIYQTIYRRELSDLNTGCYRRSLRLGLAAAAWLDRHPTITRAYLAAVGLAAAWHVFMYA